MAKKKISTSLTNSKEKRLPAKKKPSVKSGKVDHLSPLAKNKSSLTENIRSRSGAVKDSNLGKIQRVPLNKDLNIPKKK